MYIRELTIYAVAVGERYFKNANIIRPTKYLSGLCRLE
jgi:hypothetical protein